MKFDMRDSSKICRENSNFIKIEREYRLVYMKINKTFCLILNLYSNPTNAHDYNVSSHIINYQQASIAFDTITRVALH